MDSAFTRQDPEFLQKFIQFLAEEGIQEDRRNFIVQEIINSPEKRAEAEERIKEFEESQFILIDEENSEEESFSIKRKKSIENLRNFIEDTVEDYYRDPEELSERAEDPNSSIELEGPPEEQLSEEEEPERFFPARERPWFRPPLTFYRGINPIDLAFGFTRAEVAERRRVEFEATFDRAIHTPIPEDPAYLDDFLEPELFEFTEVERVRYPEEHPVLEPVYFQPNQDIFEDSDSDSEDMKDQWPRFDGENPLDYHINDFIQAIETKFATKGTPLANKKTIIISLLRREAEDYYNDRNNHGWVLPVGAAGAEPDRANAAAHNAWLQANYDYLIEWLKVTFHGQEEQRIIRSSMNNMKQAAKESPQAFASRVGKEVAKAGIPAGDAREILKEQIWEKGLHPLVKRYIDENLVDDFVNKIRLANNFWKVHF